MRVLAACLVGFLGLGALATMGACSDSTDMGAAGSGGASGGSGGKASGGSTSTAGAGGGHQCTFLSDACNSCIQDNCAALLGTCGGDGTCQDALGVLTVCVCNPANDAEECKSTFATDGGDKALKLVECYDLNNCGAVCQ